MVYSVNKSALLEEAYVLLEEAGKNSIKKDRYKKKDQKPYSIIHFYFL